MSDACALDEINPGVGLVTGTRDIDTESTPTTTPSFEGHVGMPQRDARPIEIDETNHNPEDGENQKQQQQYEEVRSSEEANNTVPNPTLRSFSSSSASSSTSSTSSSSTTPSSVSASSSKTLGPPTAFDHPGDVVEKVAEDEHMPAVSIGQRNDATMTSLDILKGAETNIASPSPSTSSLPQVAITVPASTPVTDVPDASLDHESYGLLSLLRPRDPSNHNLSVRFAPLPELAPRKRKSLIPLGMAARSQLTRRRRMYQETYEDQDPYRPRLYVRAEFRSDEGNGGVDSAELRLLKKKVLDKLRKEEEEEPEEDSLVVLAKKVGNAGKHLWKKMVTQKTPREELNAHNEQRAASSGVTAEPPPSKTEGPVTSLPQLEKDEEKIDDLEETAQTWKGDKLQKIPFRNLQVPTLSTP